MPPLADVSYPADIDRWGIQEDTVRSSSSVQKCLRFPPEGLPLPKHQGTESFASLTPEQLEEKYDILFLQWAQDLHDQAKVQPGNRYESR